MISKPGKKPIIMYMHLMNSRPAGFVDHQLLYASEAECVSHYPKLCADVAALKREQRAHAAFRKKNNWDIGILSSQAVEVPTVKEKHD